ncbi:MAG: AMP-binding protein [Phycisphaerales bacterium]|nr:AMP-binding protein [Phycisphaerales bacterium]
MSIHWPIIRTCLKRPLSVGVVDELRSYRRIEILIAAMNLASEIERKCQSNTVGILLPTGGLTPIAALAVWILGKAVVPLNYLLKPEELQYVVDDCGTDTIITVGPMLEFMGHTPRVKNLLRMDKSNLKGVPEPRWPAIVSDDDLGVLLYTSGTSGKPKGVILSHGNVSSNVRQIREWINFGSEQVFLGCLPQFHSFGLTALTLLPLTCGCKVVYASKFVPPRIMKLFREHRPTVFIAIPSMFNALMSVKDASPADMSSLWCAVSGGEPLPDAVAARFKERFGVTIAEGYGLSETSPVTNWCRPQEYKPHSVGPALPGIHQIIVDPNTNAPMPVNTDGEVRMRGPNVMRGYYKLPEVTAAAFDERGYFRTGDIGRLDQDGHLFITGRLKEMLIIGGENVFPREIEEVLCAHESVKDAGVVGVQDPMRGELPVAFVEMKEGMSFDRQTLLTWCRGKLAGYKVPTDIRVLEALPRNPTGKVMRRELKKLV